MSAPQEGKVGPADFDNFRNSSDRSSSSEGNSSSSGGRDKSTENSNNSKNNRPNSFSKSKSKSPGSDHGGYDSKEDPFFADFYNRKKNRPKLSERIFNRKPHSSIFEDNSFVDDLRKEFDQGRKMFFDGVDPFGRFPSRGGSPSPAAAAAGGGAGSGSPRMGSRTGFPFESARSRLEDFPMFSTMRRPAPSWDTTDDPFAGAGHPFHRERNNSGSSGCASGSSTASAGEHEHIIPIRIERSDGTSTTTAPKTNTSSHAKASAHAHHNGTTGQNNPISATPIPMPAPEGMAHIVVEPQKEVHHNNVHGPQRSSTEVKKSSTPGDRSPRAQSAPPDSMTNTNGPDKKFVSNINIETNTPTPSPAGPQVTQLGGKSTKEQAPPGSGRQIPIFVEGQGGRPFPNQHRNGPMPQPNGSEGPPQQKCSRPAEREVTPPPKKPTPPKDPLEKVQDISNDVKELEVKIDQYTGTSRKEKEYLFLDEMLTRELIKLDVIETEGREDIRLARKDCIKLIQNCIAKLEAKVPLPGVDTIKEEPQTMELDTNNPSVPDQQAMEVDPNQTQQSSQSVPNNSDNKSISSSKSDSNSTNSTTAAIALGMEGQPGLAQSQSGSRMDVVVESGAGESVKVSA